MKKTALAVAQIKNSALKSQWGQKTVKYILHERSKLVR